jgi:asparagine synthase (glutamine-hydrolysing)
MCGIAGYQHIDGRPVATEVLRAMGGRMRHRGPDDEGIYQDGSFGMVHRRLSIIDLTTGKQPVFNEDRTVATILNGEIYNYREIRESLQKRGHRFSTQSDTEVLVHLYEDAGNLGFLNTLNGMFAFVIYDIRNKKLWLARDRAGKKPLYYYHANNLFAFASELKALKAVPGLATTINDTAIDCYFHYQYIPGPLTIYREVKRLPPASWLLLENNSLNQGYYWRLPTPAETAPASRNEEEYREEFEALLEDSVRLRMVSDVPLGGFLSGGIDSSMIALMMTKNASGPIHTFNIGFREQSFDETAMARRVAAALNTNHSTHYIDAFQANEVVKILDSFDEPFADNSAIATYYLCRHARSHVTVALSGDGADELLAGYNRYVAAQLTEHYNKIPAFLRPDRLIKLLQLLPEDHGYYGKSYLKKLKLFSRFISQFNDSPGNIVPQIYADQERQQLLRNKPPILDEDPIVAAVRHCAGDGLTRQMLCADFATYLPDDILVKVDRMSMAHSLEVRAPFLDYRLIEFMTALPLEYKIKNMQTKKLLKKSLIRHFPFMAQKKKQGFEVPIAAWLKNDLKEPAQDLFGSQVAKDYFNQDYLGALFAEHNKGRQDHSKKLWSVFVFLLWLTNSHQMR